MVKINPESLSTACLITRSWFYHIKPHNLIYILINVAISVRISQARVSELVTMLSCIIVVDAQFCRCVTFESSQWSFLRFPSKDMVQHCDGYVNSRHLFYALHLKFCQDVARELWFTFSFVHCVAVPKLIENSADCLCRHT